MGETRKPDTDSQNSLGLSKDFVIAEIRRQLSECSTVGWDGYDANAVSIEAVARAVSLMRALPADIPMPEVGAEPDGSIVLEWSRSKHALLSLSVGTENGLVYAWLDGVDGGHAVAAYDENRFPVGVLQQIQKIVKQGDDPIRAT